MTTPPIIDIHQKFGFGGPRSTNQIQAVFIHDTENPPSSRAIDIGNWQAGGRASGNTFLGSYHYLSDRTHLVFCNTDDWIAHGTGNRGNTVGLHISVVAKASMTRDEWLAEERNHGTLTRTAWQVAKWCKKHNLPIQFVDGAGLRAGKKGISTHNEARIAWGGTTHTDPGPGFPMDVFLDLVRQQANPQPAPQPTPTPSNEGGSMFGPEQVGALHEAKVAAQEARDVLEAKYASLINPKHEFTLAEYAVLIDAATWEQRKLSEAIAKKLGLDPDTIIEEAIKADRGEL